MPAMVLASSWTDVATAVGTLVAALAAACAAVVAVWVALWSDKQTAKRLTEERAASAKQLLEERQSADARLAEEQDRADKRLAAERKAADGRLERQLQENAAQLQAERDAEREREQLTEAYAVQVTPARMDPKTFSSQITTSNPKDPITCPCVFIVNTGHYTITKIQARFSPEGSSLLDYDDRVHLSSWAKLPSEIIHRFGLSAPERNVRNDTLTPADLGLLFVQGAMAESKIYGCYPIVRWRDQWGQYWEHKLGVVRKVIETEQWIA